MKPKIEEMKAVIASLPPRPELLPIPSRPTGRSTGNVIFAELFDDPGYLDLVRKLLRLSVESARGPFLETLNGIPEIKAKYLALLLDDAVAGFDVQDRIKQLQAKERIQEEIHATLGVVGLEADRFRPRDAARELVAGFRERLSYSPQPLSREQENQLVDLQSNGGRYGHVRSFRQEVVEQAKAVLSPVQAEALRKFAGVK
ncbi:MAG: hypothetical protein ABIZ49_12450 [Opitutaceae bacterium]